jgi:tripartite-type tricarboxylate transporter receptor subunit TctC
MNPRFDPSDLHVAFFHFHLADPPTFSDHDIRPRRRKYRNRGKLIMLRIVAVALFSLLFNAPLSAQEQFPNRPIRIIVPFTAGGPSDIVARLVAPKMAAMLGQPVIVDNRPGAGGVTGVDVAAKAAPDGYTIVLGSAGGVAISPQLDRGTPYDPERDLVPLTLGVLVPEPIVVSAATPYRTLQELLAAARAQPGKINQGSTGSGSLPHLAGELLKNATGIELTHVPYRGGAPLTTALVQNEVQVGLADLPILLPQIRAGTIRALAVGSAQRLPWLPDVPTMIELGYPSVDTNNWHGFVAPARVPEPILQRLHAALAGALKDPQLSQQLFDKGAVPGGNSRAEFGEFIKAEMAKWGEVIRRGNIRAD